MSILGLECGATTTTAILSIESETGQEQVDLEFGPANYSLMSHAELDSFLQKIKKTVDSECERNKFPPLVGIGIGMPGILTEEHKKEVTAAISGVWSDPEVEKIWVGSDIEVAFSYLNTRSKSDVEYTYQILFISGTGSVVFGKAIPGNEDEGARMIKVGGAGHILGDRGSGYAISLQALRSAFKQCEYTDSTPPILQAMMKTLNIQNNSHDLGNKDKDQDSNDQINKSQNILDLIEWSVHASKAEIASLAKTVLDFWTQDQDDISSSAVLSAIDDLSNDFKVLMNKLLTTQKKRAGGKERILIGFTGSLLTECPNFAHALSLHIENILRKMDSNVSFEFDVIKLRKSSAQGALRLVLDDKKQAKTHPSAHKKVSENGQQNPISFDYEKSIQKEDSNDIEEVDEDGNIIESEENLKKRILPTLTALPTTELRNEKSTHLDTMPILEAIELMIREEQSIYKQIRKELGKIGQLVLKITKAFKNGGRLFYVGAGTSGRLGILDASEIPPTFKAPHSWVQGIIAGGQPAVFKAVEGAEDSAIGGVLAIRERELNENDVVVGIAASGRTPFVWGALYEAKKTGAYAALLTFNPNLTVNLKSLDMIITVTVGPEVLTGSSRLKSGSATKCILNMLTTLSMCRYGKCLENLMVDLSPTNDKLRDRAARIVLIILQEEQPLLTKEQVLPILKANEYDIKKTVQVFRSTGNPDVQNENGGVWWEAWNKKLF